MFGGGNDVGANVVLTANVDQYNAAMQSASTQTSGLNTAYQSLKQTIAGGVQGVKKQAFGIAAADVATLTAGAAAAARLQDQMRNLTAQNNVLSQAYSNSSRRMADYSSAVNNLRSNFGSATSAAAQLVQTISGFERNGSTQGLTKLADTFARMGQATGENPTALAQSVLSLGQAMGTTLAQVKPYSDQLVTMADTSNTTAESLANFASTLGPLGRQLNMTQTQVTGFAAAFSKAGQDGYRASNVFSQMTSQIAQAVQTNSPVLQQYANLLGVTVQAFKSMSGANQVAGVFDAIGRQGSNSLQTLNALGFDGLSTIRTVSAVTQQSGGVGNMIRQAGMAYGNNSTGAGQNTATDQIKQLGQTMSQVGEDVGSGVLPAFQGLLTVVNKLADGVRNFMDGPGGQIVTTLASIVAVFASLASTVLSVSGPLLGIVTTLGILRSGVVSGFMSGLRGGGRVTAGGSTEDLVGSNAFALADHGRPWSVRNFNLGQRFGSGARGALGWAAAVDDAESAGMGSVLGMTGRAGYRAARGTAKLGWKYLYGPAFESALKQSADRRPWLDTMPGGSFVKGGLGAIGLGNFVAGTPAAPKVPGMGEDAAAAEATTLRSSLSNLRTTVASSGATLIAWASSLKAGTAMKDADTASTKVAAETVNVFQKTLTADTAKVNASLLSLSDAAVKASVATSVLGKNEAMGGAVGAASAVGGAAEGTAMGFAGRLGALGSGALDMVGGPFGALLMGATIGIPLIQSLFGGGNNTKPSTAVQGTGLSFAVPGVLNPLAQSSVTFNPNRPTGANFYSAAQNADFQNAGVQNITTPQQAAAMYGPYWNSLPLEQQQSLATDLMNPKSLGGNYYQFLALMRSGKYSSVTPASIAAMGGVSGGLGNMYNLAAQSNFGRFGQFAGGPNLAAAAKIFLSGDTGHVGGGFGTPQGNLFSFHPFGIGGDESAMNALVKSTTAHNFMGVGWGNTNNLTQQGSALAQALGLTEKGQQKSLANILSGLPSGSANDQMNYLLKHLSGTDLQSVMGNAGLQITNNQAENLHTAIKALNAQTTPQLVSAFKNFGMSTKQLVDMNAQESAGNPQLYGKLLYDRGVSSKAIAQAFNTGNDAQTMMAEQQYAATMWAQRAPFMSQQMYGLGSRTGGGVINPQSLLGQYNTAQGEFNAQQNNPQALQNLESAQSALSDWVTQAAQSIKSYDMTLDQINFSQQQFAQSMGWQRQAFGISTGRARTQEAISVQREDYQYALTRSRGEHDFQLQRRRAEDDYNLQRTRAQADFAHSTQQMIKQSALTMMNIYQQNPAQGTTSAQFLLYNNANQTSLLNRQEGQLSTLRGMGLSTNTIQQLGLTDANNNQELNSLFAQIQQNPALIDQLNSAVKQRLAAAGSLATDASSMSFQEQEYQFNLSLKRSAQDFGTQMKRSQTDFDTSMARSAADFRYQMANQAADFNRQLGYQAKDFNLQMAHSATQFGQSIAEQEKQMDMAAQPLDHIAASLRQAAAQKGALGDLARALENAAKASPAIAKMLGEINHTVKPPKGSLWDVLFSKAPAGGPNLGLLATLGAGTPGGGFGAGPSGPLPGSVAARMAAMTPQSGMCLSDVETAWGARHLGSTAWAQWQAEKGHRHPIGPDMPVGVPIWFGQMYGGGAGHVALNAGGGFMWSEDASNRWIKKPIWPGALGWTDDIAGTPTALPLTPGFAKGTWNLPKDMIAQIHKGEMILPAKIAGLVRQAISRGQVQNMRTYASPVTIGTQHVSSVSHTDASTNFTGPITVEAQDPAQMAKDLKRQARIKALAGR